MTRSVLIAALLLLPLPSFAQQPSDYAVAEEYCEALLEKWDLLFQWARDATPDIEQGVADLDSYARKGRGLIDSSGLPYEREFLERAYLQAMLVAVQLAMFEQDEISVMAQLKEGARTQCVGGVIGTLSEVPLPPRLGGERLPGL